MIVKNFEFCLVLAFFFWNINYISTISASKVEGEDAGIDEPTCSVGSLERDEKIEPPCLEEQKLRMPYDCQLVYAQVPVHADNGEQVEWGTYTMSSRKKGTPVRKHGDVVIQWTDPIPESLKNQNNESYGRMLRDYTWNGQETGGHYEGESFVKSVVTGIGITARSTSDKSRINILPLVPRVDDGSLTRFDSPGAGAVTRYHNYTWWFAKDIEAGHELRYSSEGKMVSSSRSENREPAITNNSVPSILPIEHLKMNGFCMDNIRPRKSRIKGAGRGAFATRDLLENSIVAPVPVALVHRDELRNHRNHKQSHQLLLNYCFGHRSSSWLLFPYSPAVNLINHYNEPNVELRWSTASNVNQNSTGIASNPSLLLELVASRPIKMGDEIYLDYGRDWEDSWWKHVREVWKPNHEHYTPSYVMDDAIQMVRTEQEQKDHPYPDNIFTSCFYRYCDRTEEDRAMAKKDQGKDSLISFRWHLTKGLYDMKNLRPCRILKRIEDKSGRSVYAARMVNRPGLNDDEVIPRNELHIVTHIPRAAIRFSDKTGTTDQHLKFAFRHEIGLLENLIPSVWQTKDRVVSERGRE
mmetsp:Transcript_8838/g.21598  ORF Transcript_8838/g.21598 Transcript_8838/m.21598 type:complete len:581 (-) Transcript_8838:148-1890(-)